MPTLELLTGNIPYQGMRHHLLLLLITICYQPLMAQHDDLRIQLDRIIGFDTEINYDDTPGFVVGLIDGDTTFTVSFGHADKTETSQLTDSTTFEVGSLTKLMTAALALRLEQEGLLSLDSSLNHYLPKDASNPRLAHLTLLDLLTHQGGLSRRPAFFGKKNSLPQDPYRYYSKRDLLGYYREYVPQKKATYQYSHTGYALLELAIESATGQTYEESLLQYVLGPLGMTHTTVALPEDENQVTPGYDHAGRPTSPWTFASFAASEGVKSTLTDLLIFAKAHLLPDSTWSDLLAPHYDSNIPTAYNEYTYAGIGWQIIKSKKWYNILMHSGMTSGHHCYMAIAPETGTGVVVLSNSVIGTQDLSFLILRMINYNWDRKTYR